ncbi:unnamed protein product [Cylindrotheca closterium]|uniref:Major facilitator superfamily (MFS) profile domain-containing protein n=1 Tax=Cylindrotheca closterium TaxID=2856 RepID=A0AAD2G145_9STRA|nr:unnamed protein product [Cylindrotheca closterium]
MKSFSKTVNQDMATEAPEAPHENEKQRICCKCSGFQQNQRARGLATIGAARGSLLGANIFISTSLLYLASEEAGCIDENDMTVGCDNKVYGFQPSSLITNIAVISGILAAIANPIIGAVVDHTDYRHSVGLYSCIAIVAIQVIQIYTVSSTWFPMAILQAFAAFLYQIVITTTFAYLPEIAFEVGEKAVQNISPKLTMVQFGTQGLFIVVVIAISLGASADDVLTAQISQGINAIFLILSFGYGWLKFLPKVEAKRVLPEGRSLWTAGFTQLFHTARHINTHYKRSIRWFFVALCFAEAGASAFAVCAITFLNEALKMSGTETGVVFLNVLIFVVPGAKLSEFVVTRTNYNTCWRLNMVYFSVTTVVGVWIMKDENDKFKAYVLGVFWGIALGWFYATQNGFFAVLVPQEQATEMAGIFNFSSLIIAWLPPLVFSALNEAGIALTYGVMHLVGYFVIAIGFLSLMPSWEKVLSESHGLEASSKSAEGNTQGEHDAASLGDVERQEDISM